MTAYIILLGAIFILASFSWANQRYSKATLFLAVMVLYLLMALRGRSVGTDTSLYISLYNAAGHSNWTDCIEVVDGAPIYGLYSKAVFMLFQNSQAIIICNSFVICFTWYIFSISILEDSFTPILFYVLTYQYFTMFNTMRQGVAIGLLLMSILTFRHQKYVASVIFIILSIGIHPSSLIALVILICCLALSQYRITPKSIVFISMLVAVIALIITVCIPIFISAFPRYSIYFTDSGIGLNDEITGQGRYRYLFVFLLVLLLLGCAMTPKCNSVLDRFLRVTTAWTCISGIIFGQFDMYARMLNYFMPFVVVCISMLLTEADIKTNSVIFRGIPLCVLSVVCLYMLTSNYSGVNPYELCCLI